MPHTRINPKWKTDGKFLHRAGNRDWMRAVTYGPFPEGKAPCVERELGRIARAGFNTVRLYTLPEGSFLDAADRAGLQVFAGLDWWQFGDFSASPRIISGAEIKLSQWLREHGDHPALSGIYVGNEIAHDLVRWMGPGYVRETIESLIDLGRSEAPALLFAYANYPSTEYLEPANADFSAFNIYLEYSESFADYLRRLHNIAGDRPLVVSEFGVDSSRNGLEKQAEMLEWGLDTAWREETAGMTVYSWTDVWQAGGTEVLDWDFGLTDRAGNAKPALAVCESFSAKQAGHPSNGFSIIVCTRNGGARIGGCLSAISDLTGGPYETIVVDDGSTDGTARYVSDHFPWVKLLCIPPSGLSTARNIGAAAANGQVIAFTDDDCEPDRDWIIRLDKAFQKPGISAAGGPNLPPAARTTEEAVIRAAPGAPSHVLLGDTTAEHLPGCNIAVRKDAFDEIGGFDPRFRTAGDDVDFCWRLSDAGFAMGFVPGAFVWHWRRPSLRAFLKQQMGYGKAERMLIEKHPSRFTAKGEARWQGFVYGGGAVRVTGDSIIYHGPMGQAGYQSIVNRMLPLRPIDHRFVSAWAKFLLRSVERLQPLARSWARNGRIPFSLPQLPQASATPSSREYRFPDSDGRDRNDFLNLLLENGWQAGAETDAWDVSKNGVRILIATERFEHNQSNNLFRIWGDPTEALQLISKN